MKTSKLFITTVCYLIFSTFLNAQSCPVPGLLNKADAVGTWKGTFLKEGKIKPVKIVINRNGESLKSEIALGNKEAQPAETVLCPQEELHLKIEQDGMLYKFRGKPKNGKMSGTVILISNEGNSKSEAYSIKRKIFFPRP